MENKLFYYSIFIILFLLIGCNKHGENPYADILDSCEKLNINSEALLGSMDQEELISYFDKIDATLIKMNEARLILDRDEYSSTADENSVYWTRETRNALYHSMELAVVHSYQFKDLLRRPGFYRDADTLNEKLDRMQMQLFLGMIRTFPLYSLELSYYKQMKEISGLTSDPRGNIFFNVELNLGYNTGEKRTQYHLNRLKNVMIDIIRNYFSLRTEEELGSEYEVYIKADLLKLINDKIWELESFKEGKLEGVKDISLDEILIYQFG